MLQETPIEFRAAASPALLERGCVNVVGLDAIKQEAGQRWLRVRDGVYARMEALLRQKLGSTDFFARIDEVSYLVTMPSADREDVNVVCLRVAYELYSSFLGQCDIDHIRVSTADYAGENMLSITPLTTRHIVSLAEKAGIGELATPEIRKRVAAEAPAESDEAVTDENEVDRLLGPPEIPSLDVEHHYVPVWSTPNNVITTYICEVKSVHKNLGPRQAMTLDQLDCRGRTQVELSCLHAGVAQLARQQAQGNRFLLGVTVSFDVLGSPVGRMEFLSACRALPAKFRQYLDFTLTEVPPGVAQTRLNNLVNTLRPFARTVSATVAPGTRDYSAYFGIGLRTVGIDCSEVIEGPMSKDVVLSLIQAAKVMKLGSFLFNVRKLTMLYAAYEAGIQLVSGSALANPCAEPRGMTRLVPEDVIPRALLSA